ncbi:hypothetical protein [Pararhodobacter zhoushanensis]|uniref:PH domain-containing protein n=1 Tax=Pararhodobacter zhoushanensis TaxID=2479545 RepID=A0ABT3GXG0_9RHOB|nr:hypothetical protein [Pararhodobacter zhoushanensis]MCW1932207.1 hypothetical protein [Pararhodobacter zhoushanensis]
MTPADIDHPLLEPDERLLVTFAPDRNRYWRDHGIMAVGLMALAGGVLWLIGSPYPAIGSLGAVLAVAVRGLYLAGETFKMRWLLTDRRLILAGGVSSVTLLEIDKARPLLGDVQLITRSGDKHLLKFLADETEVITKIINARDARARSRAS